jgi:transposase
MRSIGLDLGAKTISFCEVKDGQVIARATATSLAGLEALLGANTPKARIAIEACREAWHIHDELVARGHEVWIVDTTRARRLGIGQHGRKTDRVDAEVLARAVESGHIPKAHVLSPERRELRMQLAVRRALVETRSQYITTVRGLLRAKGVRVRSCHADHFVTRYQEADLPEKVRALCAPLVQLLLQLNVELERLDRNIEALAERDPIHALLASAPGVGLIVAAMFVSVVDEAKRFPNAHALQSYLGLVPSEHSTGGKRKLGSISKHGNSYLRSLLVQAAWALLRLRDADPLKQWAEGVAERRGKRVAVIALARRLAGVLWAMWRDGTFYDRKPARYASGTRLTVPAKTTGTVPTLVPSAGPTSRSKAKSRRNPATEGSA